MTRHILFFIIMMVSLTSVQAHSTYQYRRVMVVKDGVKTSCDDDGCFITFTDRGCYESDASGIADNPSQFLSPIDTAAGMVGYSGSGYHGFGKYYFSTDLSRLNLYVNDCIYVYQRQPSLAATGRMRPKKSVTTTPSSPGSAVIVTPVQPDPLPYEDPNKLPESYYRDCYARYERLAQSAYNSLTALGVDVRYSDGSHEGYSGSSRSSRWTEMKGELRKAQRLMRDTREEARRKGYSIPQSHWETADVH